MESCIRHHHPQISVRHLRFWTLEYLPVNHILMVLWCIAYTVQTELRSGLLFCSTLKLSSFEDTCKKGVSWPHRRFLSKSFKTSKALQNCLSRGSFRFRLICGDSIAVRGLTTFWLEFTVDFVGIRYLGGVLDFAGELNRYAISRATVRDSAAVAQCRDLADALMGQFLQVFPAVMASFWNE